MLKERGDVNPIMDPGFHNLVSFNPTHQRVPLMSVMVEIAITKAVGISQPQALEIGNGYPSENVRG